MQSGINPLKYKVLATLSAAALIAVCGVFYANYIRFINPDINDSGTVRGIRSSGCNRRNPEA